MTTVGALVSARAGSPAAGDTLMANQQVPLWWGLEDVPGDHGPCVTTLGVFDGVHRGHARLIERAVHIGRDRNLPTVLVTFDPHPARVLDVPRDTSTLTTVPQRAALVAALGVDAVLVLRFTRELAAREPADFAREVLADHLHSQAVVVGANFTFGARGAGTVDTLHELGPEYGFTTHAVGLLSATDSPCSSTYTRGCLRRGDVAAAAHALGRPHQVIGSLDHALITVPEHTALPAPGTYRALVAPAQPPHATGAPDHERTHEVDVEVVDPRHVRLIHALPLATPAPSPIVTFLP